MLKIEDIVEDVALDQAAMAKIRGGQSQFMRNQYMSRDTFSPSKHFSVQFVDSPRLLPETLSILAESGSGSI